MLTKGWMLTGPTDRGLPGPVGQVERGTAVVVVEEEDDGIFGELFRASQVVEEELPIVIVKLTFNLQGSVRTNVGYTRATPTGHATHQTGAEAQQLSTTPCALDPGEVSL